MSRTPLTDAAEHTVTRLFAGDITVVDADFARGLEVENNGLKAENQRLRSALERIQHKVEQRPFPYYYGNRERLLILSECRNALGEE